MSSVKSYNNKVVTGVAILTMILGISCTSEKIPSIRTLGEIQRVIDIRTQTIVLGSDDGPTIVLTPELSARVIAASFDGSDGENLLWADDALYDGTYFDVRPYNWNAGGCRTWLNPESLFFTDSLGTWFVPPQLDPAPYRIIDETPYGVTFEADVNLKTPAELYYQVTIRRRIGLISEPPIEIRTFMDGISYVGIDFMHSLTNRAEDIVGGDVPLIGLRNIIQLKSPLTALIPFKNSTTSGQAYRIYENNPLMAPVEQGGIVSIKLDKNETSRIGFRPESMGKGVACLRDNGNGTGVLYVLLFPIDQQGQYVGRDVEDAGDAVDLISHQGGLDGFSEIECSGPARTLARGETQSHTATLHILGGSTDRLREIGSLLLGVNLAGAHYF